MQAFVPTLVAAGWLLLFAWCFFVMICRHINPFSIFQTTSIRLDMGRYCIAKGFFNEYGEITKTAAVGLIQISLSFCEHQL
jgi:hypothetical protein